MGSCQSDLYEDEDDVNDLKIVASFVTEIPTIPLATIDTKNKNKDKVREAIIIPNDNLEIIKDSLHKRHKILIHGLRSMVNYDELDRLTNLILNVFQIQDLKKNYKELLINSLEKEIELLTYDIQISLCNKDLLDRLFKLNVLILKLNS